MRRIRDLAAACPDADTSLACRIIEVRMIPSSLSVRPWILILLNFTHQVYLHVRLGNKALDRACLTEAADHFTAAVNAGIFLSNSAVDPKYEEFVVVH